MKKIEKIIFLIILLSIVHIFLEELAVIFNWTTPTKHLLIWMGFTFDFIFTVEFLTRYISALKRKQAKNYFFNENGWIDFFASIPLLLFYSGIRVYYLITITSPIVFYQSSILGIFRTFKLLRVVRILRFMRILKTLGNLFQSKMENIRRNIIAVTSISLGSLILGFFIIKLIFSFLNWPGLEIFKYKREIQYRNLINIAKEYSQRLGSPFESEIKNVFKNEKRVLTIFFNNKKIFNKYNDAVLFNKYDIDDLWLAEKDNVDVLFTVIDVNKQIARKNIELLFIILSVLIGLLCFYIPYYEKKILES